MIAALTDVGFYQLRESFDSLIDLATVHTRNAGTQEEPRFEAFPSLIPSREADPDDSRLLAGPKLLIDIGGTSTKVGVHFRASDAWHILFDRKNEFFKEGKNSLSSFTQYAENLGAHICEHLLQQKIAVADCVQLGIVWSNAMTNEYLDEQRGVTGKVIQRDQYRKGEWFVEALKDGDDIASMLLEGFRAAGLQFELVLIGNDTCLTMKVIRGAHAGMVASTGLNATVVKTAQELGISESNQRIICNGELGGRFYLPEELLGQFDWVSQNERAATVELLTAGRFLPSLFVSYIR
ncbi:MAG: hypothetical protein KDD62_05235, partial [Bdellovibrionales bacterium]|nr:hypothetical protein [Bdellovibrionales bacterium]